MTNLPRVVETAERVPRGGAPRRKGLFDLRLAAGRGPCAASPPTGDAGATDRVITPRLIGRPPDALSVAGFQPALPSVFA
ncbi:hypothetical protein JCM9533A_03400 [Catenuloplanes niger JCM 9533]